MCYVGDLIQEVSVKSGKDYGEVEKAMFHTHNYPEGYNSHIEYGDEPTEGYEWLQEAFDKVLDEAGCLSTYVTELDC